jgi:hypothetical protein
MNIEVRKYYKLHEFIRNFDDCYFPYSFASVWNRSSNKGGIEILSLIWKFSDTFEPRS